MSSYHVAIHTHQYTMMKRLHGDHTQRRQASRHKMIQGSAMWGNQKNQHLLSKGGGVGKTCHLCRRRYLHPSEEVRPRMLTHLHRNSLQGLQGHPAIFFCPLTQQVFEVSPKAGISTYLPKMVLVYLKATLLHQSPRNAEVGDPHHARQLRQLHC